MVDFGQLSFAEQIRTVHDAAVLAGVSGSDLINAAFLPPRGVLVEMDPQNRGAQVSPCVLCHMETILLGGGSGKGGNEDGSGAQTRSSQPFCPPQGVLDEVDPQNRGAQVARSQ